MKTFAQQYNAYYNKGRAKRILRWAPFDGGYSLIKRILDSAKT